MATDSVRTDKGTPTWKWVLISIVSLLIVGGALYFLGLQSVQASLTQARQENSELQTQLAQAREREAMLRAQSSLYQAAVALEQSNFGTATKRVERAEQALQNVETPAVRAVYDQVQKLDVDVATNLREQRTQIITLAQKLETQAPPTLQTAQTLD